MFLFQLPEDVLFLVLSYLDPRSLCRLSQACKRSYMFISRDVVWRKIAKDIINTGLTRQGIDLCPSIPLKNRVRVSHNWIHGVCRKEVLLKWKINLLVTLSPKIQIELQNKRAANISAYHLRADGGKLQNRRVALFSGHQEDVCRFTLTDTHLISAGGDGKIIVHDRGSDYSVEYYGHNQEVNCIDCKGGVIVSGSRDKTAKIWALGPDRFGQCLHTIPTYDRVWSVAISPSQCNFVTGTACCENFAPLRIWDTERKCVMEWEEPHDSALYCIKTDKNHMIASGSSYYGVVRLWDKRKTRCLQMFQLAPTTSSPVYSLCFNTTHLYAALASVLYSLDFRTAASQSWK
ncbi:F-box/WD repeat-containing protein 4 isoform X4 [Carassius gibelio]|uniref:F-box/WD repeat-containing protein 4 isoform X4 n=1 Tax=Carassius gibelio TaxID=101364 RepID=UPI00227895E3|nr:F-box/WD repeat-containing protein 4 isoform X4 [Carassius gibelio]